MMDSIGKLLPVVMGGGSGGGIDPGVATLISNCARDKDGFGHGGMGMIFVVLLFLLIAGRGGLGGLGCGATPAEAAAGSSSTLIYANMIDSIKTAVAQSTQILAQTIDNASERSQAANNAQFLNLNGSIAGTNAKICGLGEMIGSEFRDTERVLNTSFVTTNANINGVKDAVNCGLNSLGIQTIAGINQLQNQGNANTNLLTTQASQNYCNLSGQIKDVRCDLDNTREKLLAQGEINTQRIIDNARDLYKDNIIAAQGREIEELKRRNQDNDIRIAIGNTVNTAIGSIISGLTPPAATPARAAL